MSDRPFPRCVPKVWGNELIIVNNDNYCGKILLLNPGYQSSLHYHEKKHETFYVLEGTCYLEIGAVFQTAALGHLITIEPKTPHRFFNPTTSLVKIIEFSTHDDDADSIRIELSKQMKGDFITNG